jgi:LexA-binding, inner membrane-associated putative hydrolase
MPSPVGHGLGGIAAAWPLVPERTRRAALIVAATAIAPDLDLLVGTHRAASHSVGAAAIAGLVMAIVARRDRLRWGGAVALAWLSHVLLDWLSNDTRPPIGIMALWPFTHDYYKAAVEIFPPVSRRYWESRFWLYNLRALVVEVCVLGPIAWAITWRGRRRGPNGEG